MPPLTLLKQPSAILPLLLSLAALTTVFVHLAMFGPAPQPDEGAAAHIFQLLMVAQAPIIGFFAIRWLPRSPRSALQVLLLQVGAAFAALAPVFWLGW